MPMGTMPMQILAYNMKRAINLAVARRIIEMIDP